MQSSATCSATALRPDIDLSEKHPSSDFLEALRDIANDLEFFRVFAETAADSAYAGTMDNSHDHLFVLMNGFQRNFGSQLTRFRELIDDAEVLTRDQKKGLRKEALIMVSGRV